MNLVALSLLLALHASPADPPPTPPTPTPPPTAPWWLASRTIHGTGQGPDVFAIVRVDDAGLAVVLKTSDVVPMSLGWVDAHTLVGLTWRAQDNVVTAHWYVDGVPVHHVDVPASAWRETPPDMPPDLAITSHGEAFATHCLETQERGRSFICTREMFVALSREAAPVAIDAFARAPRDVLPERTSGSLPPPPKSLRVKPPAAPRVTLGKTVVNGERVASVRCEPADGAAVVWPTASTINWEFAIRPKRVTWLMTTPPLFAVSGTGRSPIDERYDGTLVFRACEPEPLEAFRWLGDGLWARGVQVVTPDRVVATSNWTVYRGDVALGTFPGDNIMLYVAPR